MLAVEMKDKKHDEMKDKKDDEVEMGSVVKVIEVIGTSRDGFDEAIRLAIKTAASSLRHITGADVKHMTVSVEDGKVTQYRVDLKVAFALDSDD
ncbi:MAG: dodecin family protein [Candidatus Limnocylindria bacterium]|nr:dodecin family protein [Candidatus Limnocylindria bacterium]